MSFHFMAPRFFSSVHVIQYQIRRAVRFFYCTFLAFAHLTNITRSLFPSACQPANLSVILSSRPFQSVFVSAHPSFRRTLSFVPSFLPPSSPSLLPTSLSSAPVILYTVLPCLSCCLSAIAYLRSLFIDVHLVRSLSLSLSLSLAFHSSTRQISLQSDQ